MNKQIEHISNDDIHAYVDGLLSKEKSALIEQRMQSDVQLRETIALYQQQNNLLHQAFDPVLDEAIPQSMTNIKVRNRPFYAWRNIAASISLFLGGGFAGWGIHGSQLAQSDIVDELVQPATIAHLVYSSEVKHPVEVGADQEQHLVKWLSKRLGNDIRAPQLSNNGYDLVGGRLLPGKNGPAAQFMYQDRAGHRITLYVRTKESSEMNTAFRFYQRDSMNAFYWIDGNLGYVLSGDIPRTELLQTANTVYQQLSF